jgi:hypothetical protein
MTAQELYSYYKSANYENGTEVEEFDDMPESYQQVWVTMAQDITDEIDDAVVEALPGTKAGERTD